MSASLVAEAKSHRAPSTVRPTRRSKVRLWLIAGAIGLVALGVWQVHRLFFGANFHTVIPGRIYRGGQPDAAAIESLIDQYGIRTVINLRGCCNPFGWYLEESSTIQRRGIAQEDICFSAGRLPSAHELARLVEVLDQTEYPVYFHCRRGSDRTGLAAAVALLLLPDKNLEEAREQLSLRYGHFPVARPGYLDEFLNLYESSLSRERQSHSPEIFRRWLAIEYRGGWCNYEIERFEALQETPTAGEPLAFRVRFRNKGTGTWRFRASPTGGIHAGYLVHDDQGREVARGRGGFLDRDVPPGEAMELTLVLAPIPNPGRYRLLVDLVEEGHCWFYQTGTEPREEELVIREKTFAIRR